MIVFEQKNSYDIDDLIEIVKLLRSEDGCPWDKVQTHKSIRKDFIEETYEAVEAIDLEDTDLLREELGDVLLQVVFHCQIEREFKHFEFSDICDELCKKLIVRHPHVFGDVKADSMEKVLSNWDAIKKDTKHQETYTDTLESVAKSLPALMRAQKVGKRAMRAGLDYANLSDTIDALQRELDELKEALRNGDKDNINEELGDVLFSATNVARHADADAEELLTGSTEKFIRRFSDMEKLIRQDGKDFKNLNAEELDGYWRKVKENFT